MGRPLCFFAPRALFWNNGSRNWQIGRGIDAQGTMLSSRVTGRFW